MTKIAELTAVDPKPAPQVAVWFSQVIVRDRFPNPQLLKNRYSCCLSNFTRFPDCTFQRVSKSFFQEATWENTFSVHEEWKKMAPPVGRAP